MVGRVTENVLAAIAPGSSHVRTHCDQCARPSWSSPARAWCEDQCCACVRFYYAQDTTASVQANGGGTGGATLNERNPIIKFDFMACNVPEQQRGQHRTRCGGQMHANQTQTHTLKLTPTQSPHTHTLVHTHTAINRSLNDWRLCQYASCPLLRLVAKVYLTRWCVRECLCVLSMRACVNWSCATRVRTRSSTARDRCATRRRRRLRCRRLRARAHRGPIALRREHAQIRGRCDCFSRVRDLAAVQRECSRPLRSPDSSSENWHRSPRPPYWRKPNHLPLSARVATAF